MNKYERTFLILSGIFFACLIICNAIFFKFIDVPMPLVGKVTVSVGLLPYPITFLVTDLISELYGKKRANTVVAVGFLLSMFFLFFIYIGRILPVAAGFDPEVQEHFVAVFGQTTRAIFGSMTAYLVAQFLDVRIFHFLKKMTKGRFLWLRNNGSTLISQLVDTTLVITILFYDQPERNLPFLILSGYSVKLLIALIDTPLFYLGVFIGRDIIAETNRREEITHSTNQPILGSMS